MKKNKYLISSGCSFTAGHTIGETASWATHLAQELDLELINFGKGGSGNEPVSYTHLTLPTTPYV